MNTQVKIFPFSSGNSHFVSSTPIPGKRVTEAFNFSWPSPITQGHQRDVEHTVKSSAEKAQEWVISQDLTSQRPGTNLEKVKPQKFPALTVVEDTDEEDEMAATHAKRKSLKSSLVNNNRSRKKQKLTVRFSKNNQRKDVADQRSKGATNSQRKTQKNLEPQVEIMQDSEDNIIKDQRQRTQNEYSPKKKNNALGKKQSVKSDHKIDPKQKKNSVTVQTAVRKKRQNEENEKERTSVAGKQQKRSLRKSRSGRLNLSRQHSPNKSTVVSIAEQQQEKQSLRKSRSGRLNPSRQHSPTKSTDIVIAEQQQEKQNLRKSHSERLNLSRQHSPSKSTDIVIAEKQSLRKFHSERLNLSLQRSPNKSTDILIAEQQQEKQSLRKTHSERLNLSLQHNPNKSTDILIAEQQQEKQSLRKTHSEILNLSRQHSPNKSTDILIAEQQQEKQILRKTHSGILNLSQQHSPNKSIDSANIQDTAPETDTRLPAVTENTDDDRRTQKLTKLPQKSQSLKNSNSAKDDGRRAQQLKKSLQESQTVEDGNFGKGNTSSGSRKRLLFSHEKLSFSTSEISINENSPRKHSYLYPFLEEMDNIPKRRPSMLRWKRIIKNNSAKKSQNVTKTKRQSNTAESAQKGKRKINSKEDFAGDLRRSKRTRVKPLAHWIGERLCYKPGPDLCFEIVGVEPACNAEPIHRQRNNTDAEHIAFNIPLQTKENPELKMVQIINEGRRQDVECFSTLRPESVTPVFSKYKMLDNAVAQAGLIKLAPSAKSSLQSSPAHYVFFILKGHGLVEVHNMTKEVKSGELFQVPKGISYSIENLSNKPMVLHFVMVK